MRKAAIPAALTAALMTAAGLLTAPMAQAQQAPPSDPGKIPIEAGVAPGTGVPDARPADALAGPQVSKLQHSANDVQKELGKLTSSIHKASGALAKATKKLRDAEAEKDAAEAGIAKVQDEIDAVSRSAYTGYAAPSDLELMLTATDAKNYLQESSFVSYIRDGQDAKLRKALARRDRAVKAERAALGYQQQANKRRQDLNDRKGDASNRADAISSELTDPISKASAAVTAQQAEQKKRNDKFAKAWKDYVARLTKAQITPPHAGSLSDPHQLPGDLKALKGANGKPQAGLAKTDVDGKGLLVLPKETIDAVSAAVDALGRPYVPRDHGTGPKAFSCDGLVKRVFGDAGLDEPASIKEQYALGKPVSRKDIRPGDLVFAGPAKYGVQHVGIALDPHNMIAADGRLSSVAVTDIPAGPSLLGVTRPALGTGQRRSVPRRAKGELTWRCGGIELPLSLGVNVASTAPTGSASPAANSNAPGAAGAWGGYPNGLIPSSALCSIGVGSHALRCDAAQAWVDMSKAFQRQFHHPLCITDSYRSFQVQVRTYRTKPGLAAVPGTSNHGWGLAVDLCGGIERYNTPQYNWMKQNAPHFGWVHPAWAEPGNGREEPWHWEYGGIS